MAENSDVLNKYIQIRNQFRSKSRGRSSKNNFSVLKKDIYHNLSPRNKEDREIIQQQEKSQFVLDLSKININNSQQDKAQPEVIENTSYVQFQKDLNLQYDKAVQDQIYSERQTKQKQLYIPNLRKHLEDFKKRKYQSPSVSQSIVAKNPSQKIEFPQECIQKLANDMIQNYKQGKQSAKYEQIMDFIKGKPFYLKLGEMKYRKSEKNQYNIQEQPINLQYQHIREKNQQMGERPLSKEKRIEQDQQTKLWLEQQKNIIQDGEQNNLSFRVRCSSNQQKRQRVASMISSKKVAEENLNGYHFNQLQNKTPSSQDISKIWNNSGSIQQQPHKEKDKNINSRQNTPNSFIQPNQFTLKKKVRELSISKTAFESVQGAENEIFIEQSSTRIDDLYKTPNAYQHKQNYCSPNNASQETYSTFLTQDLIQSNFENTSQKIDKKTKSKDLTILVQGDTTQINNSNNNKNKNSYTPLNSNQNNNSLDQKKHHQFQFEKQALVKLNLKLQSQLRERSQQQNQVSQTHRVRPESHNEFKDVQYNSSSNTPRMMYKISRNQPRSVLGNRLHKKEDSIESLACSSILNDCNDIIKGSSIEQIGQADYFNEKYYEKNLIQNERKHKIKKDLIQLWNQNKNKNINEKEKLQSEEEEQQQIIKQYKDQQPFIKNQLQKSGAIIDRYFQSLNVVKPFFQKKIQSKSIL
ncbi:hypothetical protein TTHERM_00530040 (macronuclear) [Tetrahymena thermophila SB210]|uniref:Uncharacterized protein n=1 Tax=Tetrahymena thermophila (strain SB210) TaxID=312017 RepID=I7LTD6_TETTS|nr:hypothetical protein TTHERM_00530040 [Tetrahymena thermophila SB210]EAR85052.4 hypothetical protein TTHERM_00530040 [Tetrahymena thermophila SB210]|eukprot:XP_001032715.4 hypothetical protein TTHERM_00530040 [Tetrahymena thermophila SB210]